MRELGGTSTGDNDTVGMSKLGWVAQTAVFIHQVKTASWLTRYKGLWRSESDGSNTLRLEVFAVNCSLSFV